VGAKIYVTAKVEASLARQGVEYERLLVSAGPFNTALWRIVAMQGEGHYYEGYYSLLDGSDKVSLARYASNVALLEGIARH
ncbi:MAG: metal-dependent hydrolase, partial [Desulfuromonadales bacterium]|nr:metal-dependent hydrolase [Desulfuromonadales bacterium]NIS39835.1 metal-dependent hydrolase [Desulfuromonadales bacterium]